MNEAQLKQKIIQKLESMGQQKLTVLNSLIDSLEAYLQSPNISPVEKSLDEVQRHEFIRSLRGKYAQAATSSDEFAQRKQVEIDREERLGR